jgi:pyridoxine 4-dehydrogenase
MTLRPDVLSDEQCFEAIIAGINAVPSGTKVFLNSGMNLPHIKYTLLVLNYLFAGEFYGTLPHDATTNLELLNRFFTKYPEHAERTFLSVKVSRINENQRFMPNTTSFARGQSSWTNVVLPQIAREPD